VESVLDLTETIDGPVYIRMLRGEVPRLFPVAAPMRLNRARLLGEGRDVAVLSGGICTEEALRAAAFLRRQGVGVLHLHVSCLKPFSDPAVIQAVSSVRSGVITVENHSIIGGLGSATAELMAGAGLGQRLIRLGLKDRYAHGASRAYLMREYGLDAGAVVEAAEDLLATSFGARPQDLAAMPLPGLFDGNKAEDL
jgi:transketolase